MSNTNHRSRGHTLGLVAALISVSVAAFLFFNRQFVIDQVTIWQYQPSQPVVQLVERAGMNDKGEFYFYASTPTLESTQVFNDKCGHRHEATAILGCYTSQKIYIYNVIDTRLDGIREVTAAHEMLHAAYERMGDGERKKVDALLETEYNKLKNDKDLSERMAFYARTEPGQRDNELHSVIGTEVASLSPELEEHYKKYFENRQKVVSLHAKYASVFSNLQKQSAELVNELNALEATIKDDTASYNTAVNQLDKEIESFNARANGGGFSSQAQFNAEHSDLVERIAVLNRLRDTINDKIGQYESLRKELASIASTSEALNKSIDSSLAPAPSI